MAAVLRTRQAEEDLLEIWDYIADDNPIAADDLLDEIDAACTTLAENPNAGRLREQLAPALRSFPVGNYVLFYRPGTDGIVLIPVLHGARDVSELL